MKTIKLLLFLLALSVSSVIASDVNDLESNADKTKENDIAVIASTQTRSAVPIKALSNGYIEFVYGESSVLLNTANIVAVFYRDSNIRILTNSTNLQQEPLVFEIYWPAYTEEKYLSIIKAAKFIKYYNTGVRHD